MDDVTLRHFRGRPSRISRVEVIRNSAYLTTFDIAPSKILYTTAFVEEDEHISESNSSQKQSTIEEKKPKPSNESSGNSVSNWFLTCCCCKKKPKSHKTPKKDVHANGLTLTPVVHVNLKQNGVSENDIHQNGGTATSFPATANGVQQNGILKGVVK